MTLIVASQIDVLEATSGAVLVRINNNETIQVAGPLIEGDLVAAVIERLSEDVTTRATEQARDCFKHS